ncbi:MAG: hypothetical protein LBG46_06620 [Elusimicrobiota bacterium]|nr:hypothetical protein [Elusimicrobiota bacterium]
MTNGKESKKRNISKARYISAYRVIFYLLFPPVPFQYNFFLPICRHAEFISASVVKNKDRP